MADPHEIVLGEATRLLARQEVNLDTLRTRSLGVLTAGGLVTGVLGALADSARALTLVAVALISLSAVLAMVIHWPIKVNFSHDLGPMLDRVERMHETPVSSLDVAFNWARDFDNYRKLNKPKIDKLVSVYQVMCLLLALEVVTAVGAVALGS